MKQYGLLLSVQIKNTTETLQCFASVVSLYHSAANSQTTNQQLIHVILIISVTMLLDLAISVTMLHGVSV